MSLRKVKKALKLANQTIGDVQAAKNGTLGKRIAKRTAKKAITKLFK